MNTGPRTATLLIRKLQQFTKLSVDDKRALDLLASEKVRQLRPHQDIFGEGDKPLHINLILDGWAARYKLLEDGRRQITTFLLPGDLCDVRMFILKRMDHSVSAVSHATVAQIPASDIMSLTEKHPRLARAFWWSSLVEEAINREWIVNLGQRPALERMAHLFCEIFVRLDGVGLTSENSCEIPLTQAELGEALGISTVHVNRTLMELRDSGLLSLEGRTLEIPDLNALKTAASFNENYLHLDREGQEFDANET